MLRRDRRAAGDRGAGDRRAHGHLGRAPGQLTSPPAERGTPFMNSANSSQRAADRAASTRSDGIAEGIARLRRALRRGARVADPGNKLAVAHLEVLAALTENPGARPGQLARQLHMRPNTVTTIVNALSAQGMLNRVSSAGDRRAIELTVTEAGNQA